MALNDPAFVVLFLPVVLGLFWLTGRFRPGWSAATLLAASLAFYAFGDLRQLPTVGILILINFAIGRFIGTAAPGGRARNTALAAGVALNLGVLALHKYGLGSGVAGAFGSEAANLTQGAMPLGLSFIVLQQVTWLVDAWRDPVAVRALPPGRFALYSLFFPQMIAGPILRYADGAKQYQALGRRPVAAEDVARGLSLFIIGLAKKVLIADQIGRVADPLFTAAGSGYSPTFLEAWIAGWAYLLQLYFDFSGLSDMAIGIGLMVGLRLPVNFNSPLKARNGSECFDRWHMSLTAFVRAYVFAPLYAAIRHRAPGRATARTMIAWAGATVVSLSLVGWWHGARPTFVISGFLIGVAAVLLQLRDAGPVTRPVMPKPVAAAFGHVLIVVGLIVFGVFFRAADLATVGRMLGGLMQPWTLSLGARAAALLPDPIQTRIVADGFLPGVPMPPVAAFAALALGTVIVFAAPNTLQIFGLWDHPGAPGRTISPRRLSWRPDSRWAAACAFLLTAALIVSVGVEARAALYGEF